MRTLLVGVVLVAAAVAQTARFVPQQYATIGAAIIAANHGDTIVVAPGIYAENGLTFAGKRLALVSTDGPDVTTIAGGGVRILEILNNEPPGTRVAGFTFDDGFPAIEVQALGGAPALSHLDVSNCVFQNSFSDSGGAMKVRAGSVIRVRECTFFNNSAAGGGGAVSVNNPFSLNPLSFGGTPPDALFDGCVFEANAAPLGGGSAIDTVGATRLVLRNSIIVANTGQSLLGQSSTINCRGIAIGSNNHPVVDVHGCTILGNANAGILAGDGAQISLVNTILRGNGLEIRSVAGVAATLDARYCNVLGGLPASNPSLVVNEVGTMDVDPMLDAQYRQLPGSPMLDAGDPVVGNVGIDPFGGQRLVDGDRDGTPTADVGAHELQRIELTATTTDPLTNTVFDLTTTAPHIEDVLLDSLLLVGIAPAVVPVPGIGSLLLEPAGMLVLGTSGGTATLFNPGLPGITVVCQSANFVLDLTNTQTHLMFSNAVNVRL